MEPKVLMCQAELTQVRQEIKQCITQKDKEFASTKKKLEADIIDLHTALEHANAANAESQRQIKVI